MTHDLNIFLLVIIALASSCLTFINYKQKRFKMALLTMLITGIAVGYLIQYFNR